MPVSPEDKLEAVALRAEKAKAALAEKELEAAEAKAAATVAPEPVAAAADDKPKLRRRGAGSGTGLVTSDVPYPKDIHGEDYESYGPSGVAAVIPPGTEISEYSEDQQFVLDTSKLEFFRFKPTGGNLPGRARLYTVKGIHKDGRLVQLGFEGQIENTAGGDPGDAIGLRRYQRKGITVLIDWQTMMPLYCAAFECWAQASAPNTEGQLEPLVPQYPGFCSKRHAIFTLPNTYNDAGEQLEKMFGERATTTAVWSI